MKAVPGVGWTPLLAVGALLCQPGFAEQPQASARSARAQEHLEGGQVF